VKAASQEGLNNEQQEEQGQEQHPPVEGGFLPVYPMHEIYFINFVLAMACCYLL